MDKTIWRVVKKFSPKMFNLITIQFPPIFLCILEIVISQIMLNFLVEVTWGGTVDNLKVLFSDKFNVWYTSTMLVIARWTSEMDM